VLQHLAHLLLVLIDAALDTLWQGRGVRDGHGEMGAWGKAAGAAHTVSGCLL
jgi:hypothetical protein